MINIPIGMLVLELEDSQLVHHTQVPCYLKSDIEGCFFASKDCDPFTPFTSSKLQDSSNHYYSGLNLTLSILWL